MRRRNYYFSLVLAALATSAAAVELSVQRVGPEHGLAHNAVNSLLEDRQGFLWLGTQDGLQRYDGVEFETFRADGSALGLSHSNITALFETSDGSLWVGTTAGLDVLSPDRQTLTHAVLPASDGKVAVNRIAQAPSGAITLSTRGQGLLTVEWMEGQPRLARLIRAPARILDHSWTADGELLVLGYVDDMFALLRLDAHGDEVDRAEMPNSDTTSIVQARRLGGARLTDPLLQTGYFSDGRHWLWRTALMAEGADTLVGSSWGLHVQSESESSARKIDLVGVEQGLATEVLALVRDRSGTLWIGTYGGLLRADPATKDFRNLLAGSVAAAEAISSIVPTPSGESLLVGSFGRGVREVSLADGTALRHLSPAELSGGACSDYVWSAVETVRGMMVTATNSGVCSFDRSGALAAVIGLGNYRHTGLDGQGGLWIAGPTSLLHLAPDGVSTADFELPSETIRVVSATEVWLGPLVYPGAPPTAVVKRLNPENRAVREYSLSRQTSVYDLQPQADGRVLVATSDGLMRLDAASGAVTQLLPVSDVGVVYSVQPEDGNVVWLGTSRGMVRVVLGSQPPTAQVFGVDDGVGNHEFNRRSRLKTDDGRIFLGGMNGITTFDPERIAPNRYAPPTRLKTVRIEGRAGHRTAAHDAAAQLRPGDFAIDFEFAALSFTRADRNRYRYRMRGIDQGWVDAGTRRSARYAGLAPGDYSFEVLGSNNDGVWSPQPAVFDFAVLPPFHQTWWARLLGLALAAAVLAWLYRLRTRRLIEMEQMRLRIASDLHDELGSELSGIALTSSLIGRSDSLQEDDRMRLADVADSSRRVMEGLRDIVWYVNPEHDCFDSLVDRMQDTARRLSGDIAVEFTADPVPRAPRLDMQARRQLFLIYKELLANAVRHSGGTKVAARLARYEQGLQLAVTDNGSGFDPGAASNGSGLGSVRRRAERLGGVFELQSTSEGGTRALLRVPLT